MTKINVEEFVDTPVIQKLKQKNLEVLSEAKQNSKSDEASVTDVKDEPKVETKSTPTESATRSARGRKRKYNTAEERIQARRAQQKAYRERKKKEFEELKAKACGPGSSSQAMKEE